MIDDESIELAVKIIHLIRGHGIYKLKPSKDDKSTYMPFLQVVHDGWKLAQSIIADKLIENLTKLKGLEETKSIYHQQHRGQDKDAIIERIKQVQIENMILRRMIDSIVWAILDNENSTIRRLPMKKSGDNLSIQNIEDTRSFVDDLNQCPFTIAIISDITTFVHHGDIVERSLSGVRFIELKSGQKGISITNTAKTAQKLNCAIASEILTRDFNTKDKKQYTRTSNQIKRNEDLASTLKSGKGPDALSGLEVRIQETKIQVELYNESLVLCRKRLEDHGTYAIITIDNCLHIGMYKTLEFAYVGFSSWMKGIECKSKIYNITDSFHDPLSRPLLSLDMPTEFIIEALKGDIIMVACLDIQAFYDLAERTYPNMLSLTKPPSLVHLEEMQIDRLALTMTVDGDAGVVYLGDGLISRMVFDLQRPSNILKMQYERSGRYYYLPPPTHGLAD